MICLQHQHDLFTASREDGVVTPQYFATSGVGGRACRQCKFFGFLKSFDGKKPQKCEGYTLRDELIKLRPNQTDSNEEPKEEDIEALRDHDTNISRTDGADLNEEPKEVDPEFESSSCENTSDCEAGRYCRRPFNFEAP